MMTYEREWPPKSASGEKWSFCFIRTPWLAVSPGGLVHDPDAAYPGGLVETKNPYSVCQMSLEEAVKTSSFCVEYKKQENKYTLKRKQIIMIKSNVRCIALTEIGATLSCELMWPCTYKN